MMESLVLVRVFRHKCLERRTSVRVFPINLESFLRDPRKIYVDAFRDFLRVMFCGSDDDMLLSDMKICPLTDRKIGSSQGCDEDGMLAELGLGVDL